MSWVKRLVLGNDHWITVVASLALMALLWAATSLEWYYILTLGALASGVIELMIRGLP